MKKVNVKWNVANRPDGNVYFFNGMKMCWLSKPINNEYLQHGGWHSCRETFSNVLINQIVSNTKSSKKNSIGLDRFRAALLFSKLPAQKKKDGTESAKGYKLRKNMANKTMNYLRESKRVLNLYEEHLGWAKTGISMVDGYDNFTKFGMFPYVINSSPKWMKSTMSLSLCLLITRLGMRQEIKKLTSVNDIDIFIASLKKKGRANLNSDLCWVCVTGKYWLSVLENNMQLVSNNSIDTLKSSRGTDGIGKLVDGIISNKKVLNEWKKINQ